MLGQLARCGTGAFDLLLDGDRCKEAMDVPQHRVTAGLGHAGLSMMMGGERFVFVVVVVFLNLLRQ
jgi:hypothetical protein